jgi:hypothetical protein
LNAVSLKQPFLTRDGVIRLVLLVLLLGFGVWIARNTYWEDVAVPAQLRGEALRNQNYSIERLAALLGIHTHVLVSLDSLPARDGVLLLGEFNVRAPTPDQVQALEHWVERGGRLILPRYVLGSNPELQRWSGIKSVPMPKPAAGGADRQIVVRPPVTTLATRHRNDCPAMQVSADGTPTGESLVVCDLVIGDGFTSERTPAWALRDAAGTQILRVALGRGSVTVIGPVGMYSNIGLFSHQHARAFIAAAALARGDDLWILAPNRAEPLLALLWRLGAPAIACLLLAIACSIWRSLPRFGPLAPEPPLVRRSLAEQIRADARFAWRSRSLAALHAAALRSLEERARRVIESYELHDPAQRLDLIAARAQIPAQQLGAAMRPVNGRGGSDERAAILLLEQTRRRL